MVKRPDKIALWIIRHGKPDVPANARRVTREEFNQYLVDYDQAGLSAEEAERLSLRYRDYPKPGLVLASDLPRALETAKIFARGTPIVTDPLLREVPVQLPQYDGWFLNGRWPGEVWWSYLRLAWFRGLQRETPDVSRARARQAIELLEAHRYRYGPLAIVSHSGFLLILINQMHRERRISGPRLPSIEFGRPTGYQWSGKL